MNRTVLYYIAAFLWGMPGVIIAIKGIKTYLSMPSEDMWWLMLITAFVLVGFFFMFRKAVDKYSAHIASQPEKTGVWATFSLGIGANAHLRRIPIHIKSKKDRLLSSRSFSLISIRTLYPKNEISTPAATAEPMTPEMLDAIQ